MIRTSKGKVRQRLVGAGQRLPHEVRRRILERGAAAVPELLAVLEDPALARDDAPGQGLAPLHAAELLAELRAPEAIRPMLDVLASTDWLGVLHERLVVLLAGLGPAVVEPALAMHAAAADQALRTSLCRILAQAGAGDARVFPLLLALLDREPILAGLLADFGDRAALPHLGRAFDGFELRETGTPLENYELFELRDAILHLGGTLSPAQEARYARAFPSGPGPEAAADAVEPVLARFEDSPEARALRAAGFGDGRWVELLLTWAADHLARTPAALSAEDVRRVVFDLFPSRGPCRPEDASAIVVELRAYFQFAERELGFAGAAGCRAALGTGAEFELARELADPHNFGVAKSFLAVAPLASERVEDGLAAFTAAAPRVLAEPATDPAAPRARTRRAPTRTPRRRSR